MGRSMVMIGIGGFGVRGVDCLGEAVVRSFEARFA